MGRLRFLYTPGLTRNRLQDSRKINFRYRRPTEDGFFKKYGVTEIVISDPKRENPKTKRRNRLMGD